MTDFRLHTLASRCRARDESAVLESLDSSLEQQTSPVATLLEKGLVDEKKFLHGLATQFQLPWWDAALPSMDDALRALFPARLALSLQIYPVRLEEYGLYVLTYDPFNLIARQQVAHACPEPITWCVAPRRSILDALRAGYGIGAETFDAILEGREVDVDAFELQQEVNVLDDTDAEASVVSFVNQIMREALVSGSAVVGQALANGMTINHYSMCHAAASASLYSSGSSYYLPAGIPGTSQFSFDNDPDPNTSSPAYSSYQGTDILGYKGLFAQIGQNVKGGPIVNCFDENDSVIAKWWDINSQTFKPQFIIIGGYQYSYIPANPPSERVEFGDYKNEGSSTFLRYVLQSDEARAYIDHPETESIGSQPGIKGAVGSSYDEDAMGDDHSYEWECSLQDPTTFSFYSDLLTSFKFKTIFP